MSAYAQDLERRLVPRWRFSNTLANPAEFASDPRNKRPSTLNKAFLDEKLFDWELNRSIGNAIDLVSCGVSGRWLDEVQPAAEFLQKRNDILTPQVNALAERAVQLTCTTAKADFEIQSPLSAMTFDHACLRVANTRRKLHRDPRNVLAWLDLARAYIILGQREKAVRSIECALYLAPHHRQVLRSAVRLFVHTEQKGRAHTLLVRNARTRNDPWLIAAEIATAKIAERNPQYIRQGRQLVESSGLPPEQLTELQSALGTAEFYSGANRKAKQRFRASLMAPTDNALAQARWMRTQIPGIHIDENAFSLPLGFEARSWRALEEGRWADARMECEMWLTDEPYSSRPAIVGSYVGISLTNDFAFAEACARAGLRADPSEETLQNNLTVALAYQGQLDEAIQQFKRITMPLSVELPIYVYVATAGLIHFRLGEIERGRELYAKAEQFAPKTQRHRVAIFRAREELAAGTAEANEHLQRALDYKAKDKDKETVRIQMLLKKQSEELNENQNRQGISADIESAKLRLRSEQLSPRAVGCELEFKLPLTADTNHLSAFPNDNRPGERSLRKGGRKA